MCSSLIKKTSSIWQLCDKWVGIQNVHHNEAHSHWSGFELAGLGSKRNDVWRMVWMSIIWNTWKHKNEVIFRNRKCDVLEVLAVTQVNTWAFIASKYGKSRISFSN